MLEERTSRIFEIGRQAAEQVAGRAGMLEAADKEEHRYKMCMLFFFAKGYKTYQAIRSLWEAGFPEDAFMLTRSLFELVLQALFVDQDPRERAKRFAEHGVVERYRLYEKLNDLGKTDLLRPLQRMPEKLSELTGLYAELEASYGKEHLNDIYPEGRRWTGKSFRQLAEELGAQDTYLTLYWLECELAHTGETSVARYLGWKGESLQVYCYPSPSDLSGVAETATMCLLPILHVVSEALGLGLTNEISQAQADFVQLVRGS